jgi:hypothetical protein
MRSGPDAGKLRAARLELEGSHPPSRMGPSRATGERMPLRSLLGDATKCERVAGSERCALTMRSPIATEASPSRRR